MSNFEKRNLRSGHLIRPGHVTFGVSGSSFFGNVSNCWLNSYGKFGGATRRRFLAICEKPYGGGVEINPPAGARVNDVSTNRKCAVSINVCFLQKMERTKSQQQENGNIHEPRNRYRKCLLSLWHSM